MNSELKTFSNSSDYYEKAIVFPGALNSTISSTIHTLEKELPKCVVKRTYLYFNPSGTVTPFPVSLQVSKNLTKRKNKAFCYLETTNQILI